ncbi:MAG: hypothetical protein HOP11_14090 [Saprospiraceae bacterium]|nr:hypothetical protein [Saprospiraceae bacterium]
MIEFIRPVNRVFFILILLCGIEVGNSQNTDSLKLIESRRKDSLNSLPLIVHKIESNLATSLHDTTNYVIQQKSFFGLSTLHNYGSPVNYLREFKEPVKGFDFGYNIHEFMTRDIEFTPSYYSNKTYAELMVSEAVFFANSQNSLIDNLNARVFLVKNFAKGIYLNLEYDRINQKGIYAHTRNLLTRLNAKILYSNDKSRWSGEIAYLNQFDNIQHSGGIPDDNFLKDENYNLRETVPVRNSSAFTRIVGDELSGKLRYRLSPDTANWTHIVEAGVGYKEYSNSYKDDTKHDSINLLYGIPFSFFRDSVYRDYYHNIVPGNLTLFSSKKDKWKISLSNHFYQVSLVQDKFYRTKLYVLDNSLNIQFLGFQKQVLEFNSSRKKQFEFVGSNFVFNYSNSILKKYKFHAAGSYASVIPGWMYNRYTVNNALIRNTPLSNVQHLGVSFSVSSPLKFFPQISLDIRNLKNIFYINSAQELVQENKNVRNIMFEIIEDFSFGVFGIYNRVQAKYYSPDPAGWTAYYGRHEVYFKGKLFGSKTSPRISVFADWIFAQNINGYHTLYGMYYPIAENKNVIGPFVGIDLKAQIADLNVHLEFANLDSFWNKARPSVIQGYPWHDFNLRLVLLWRFED